MKELFMKYPPEIKMLVMCILFVQTGHFAWAQSSTDNEQELAQEAGQRQKENDPFQYELVTNEIIMFLKKEGDK